MRGPMRETVERELKLQAPADFELPPLPGEEIDRVFTSTYVDTPARSLTAAGITLRRRLENRRSLWQLKLPRSGARAELEARGGPGAPPAELAALLTAHTRVHGELEPIAVLRTRRRGIHVVDGDRDVAEVTVDQVDVLEGRRRVDGFVELEAELTDGDDADLERLGRELRDAGAKKSDGRPKVFRALAITAPAPPGKRSSAREVLAYQLHAQLVQIEAHDPGVRAGGTVEDVHRFRVATRRTRALIRATRPVLGERLAPLADELRWLGGKLGDVRDLDVLIAHLRDEVPEVDEESEGAESVVSALEDEREARRAELLDALDSDRYLELLKSFGAAIDSLPEVDGDVRALALRELKRLEKASSSVAADSSDDELHALRIRAKRARYAGELAALTGGKKLARYVEAVTAVQDVVGVHQDAVVAEAKLRELVAPERAVAVGRLIERERERRRDARARYPDVVADALARGRAALS
jgi:CHAD domain-containing protein